MDKAYISVSCVMRCVRLREQDLNFSFIDFDVSFAQIVPIWLK